MKTRKKTILFVEDNSFVLMVYRNWLERDGFEVESAVDGMAAVEKLPLLKPNLVILDLMLPKLNGQAVLKYMREHSELNAIPVLILSNGYLDESASKIMTAGANKRITKTQCTPAILLEAVHELAGFASGMGGLDRSPAEGLQDPPNEDLIEGTGASLLDTAAEHIDQIREDCLAFAKTAGSPGGEEYLNHLYQHVRSLCAQAGLEQCTKIAHLTSALEAVLSEIGRRKTQPSPSILQTIVQTVDCLSRLLLKGDLYSGEHISAAKVLIVDDDPVCNYAIEAAMKRASLKAVSTHDPAAALEMARIEHYDVVLLDINMPGMNGFEVCEKLRQLPQYEHTPVIFITSNSEFKNRAQAVLSGGNDFIVKPIWPLELSLKTIMHLTEPLGQRADDLMARTSARPAAVPAIPKVVEPVEPPRNAVFAKVANEKSNVATMPSPAADKPKAATNGDKPKAPAVSDDLKHASQPRPPRDTEFHNRGQFTSEPSPVQRISPPQNSDGSELLAKPRNENQSFDKLTHAVTRIFFGDDKLTEMSLRLTHIALERCRVPEIINRAPEAGMRGIGSPTAGAQDEPFCQVTREVARIIFGGEGNSEMHLRLTRIALERYHVPDIITLPAACSTQPPTTK